MAETTPTDATTDEPWWPLVAICVVGVFVLAGPPIGGVVSWIAANIVLGHGFNRYAWPLLMGFVLHSYRVGVPFALASGVLHAIAALYFRRYSLGASLISSSVVAVAGLAMLILLDPSHPGAFAEAVRGILVLYGPATILASLFCWALTRKMVTRA